MPLDPRLAVAVSFLAAFWLASLGIVLWDERRRREEGKLAALRDVAGAGAALTGRADPLPGTDAAGGEEGRPAGVKARLLLRIRLRAGTPRPGRGRRGTRPGTGDDAGAVLRRDTSAKRLARRLRRAGLAWRPEEFVTLQVVVAAVGMATLVILGHSWLWAAPGFTAGWLATHLYVNHRIARRLARAAADLPAALSLMSGALKSGHSFLQATETVSREMEGPLAEEFEQLVHEVRLNVSMEDALANLVDRVRSEDVDLVVTAVLIQRQVGGNLAQVLDQIATTIRERVRLLGEVRVLTSQGRLSGWIVGLLPVALLFLIAFMNPAYMHPLYSTGLGRMMLLGAAVMEGVGALVIRRIVNIEA